MTVELFNQLQKLEAAGSIGNHMSTKLYNALVRGLLNEYTHNRPDLVEEVDETDERYPLLPLPGGKNLIRRAITPEGLAYIQEQPDLFRSFSGIGPESATVITSALEVLRR